MQAEWVQYALTVPIGILIGWVKVLSGRIDKMQITTYSKKETEKMISLHLAPLETKLDNVEKNTDEIKTMIRELQKSGEVK